MRCYVEEQRWDQMLNILSEVLLKMKQLKVTYINYQHFKLMTLLD